MRLTLRRRERGRGRATLVAAGALAMLAAGGLLAAPGGAERWRILGASLPLKDSYAVRIALPTAREASARGVAPGAREAPLAEFENTLADKPDELAAVAVEPEMHPEATVVRVGSRGKVQGVIPLNYSLAGGADAGDAIEVEKPVTIGDRDAGRIALRIDGNARVYALGSRLATIIAAQLGAAAVPEGLGEDFVSLEALRALGVGVHYDAIRDRLVIDPPA